MKNPLIEYRIKIICSIFLHLELIIQQNQAVYLVRLRGGHSSVVSQQKFTESLITMPFKQPIRDLSTVKCIKRSKDKSGEDHIEYLVLFDFVSFFLYS